MKLSKSKNQNEEDFQAKSITEDNGLTAAIKAVQDAQQALRLYMKERTCQNLANTGLLVPMRDLKGVEYKLKSYVKN